MKQRSDRVEVTEDKAIGLLSIDGCWPFFVGVAVWVGEERVAMRGGKGLVFADVEPVLRGV